MLWKSIPGFSRYEVSEIGEVRCVVSEGQRRPGPRKSYRHTRHYKRIQLVNDCGVPKQVFIHRLVALAFLGNPPTAEHEDVAHINGIGWCNHFSNLRWSTTTENMHDKRRHGTQPMGASHHRSKLTEDDVIAIRQSHENARALAERYGVKRHAIYDVRHGKTWAHVTARAA